MNQSKEARSQQKLLNKPKDIIILVLLTTKEVESNRLQKFTFEKQIVCRKCEGTTRVIENCRKCLGGEHTTFDDVQMVPLHCSECEGVSKRSYFDSITCDDCSGGLKTVKVTAKFLVNKELTGKSKCLSNVGNESRNRSHKPGNVMFDFKKSRLYSSMPDDENDQHIETGQLTMDSTKKTAQNGDEEQQRSNGDCNYSSSASSLHVQTKRSVPEEETATDDEDDGQRQGSSIAKHKEQEHTAVAGKVRPVDQDDSTESSDDQAVSESSNVGKSNSPQPSTSKVPIPPLLKKVDPNNVELLLETKRGLAKSSNGNDSNAENVEDPDSSNVNVDPSKQIECVDLGDSDGDSGVATADKNKPSLDKKKAFTSKPTSKIPSSCRKGNHNNAKSLETERESEKPLNGNDSNAENVEDPDSSMENLISPYQNQYADLVGEDDSEMLGDSSVATEDKMKPSSTKRKACISNPISDSKSNGYNSGNIGKRSRAMNAMEPCAVLTSLTRAGNQSSISNAEEFVADSNETQEDGVHPNEEQVSAPTPTNTQKPTHESEITNAVQQTSRNEAPVAGTSPSSNGKQERVTRNRKNTRSGTKKKSNDTNKGYHKED